jgi:hypothetical protein
MGSGSYHSQRDNLNSSADQGAAKAPGAQGQEGIGEGGEDGELAGDAGQA